MPRNSRGFYPIDGVLYRSSTTILKVLEKEGLHPWIAWTTAKKMKELAIDPIVKGDMTPTQLSEMDMEQLLGEATKAHKEKRDEAGDMGSLIHKVIHEYYKAGSDPLILDNHTKMVPELLSPILAFMDWQAKYKIVPLKSEHTVYSKIHGFAGTLDLACLATINDAKAGTDTTCRIIVDFKSSSGLYDGDILQIASYVFAEMEETGNTYSGGMLVRLDKQTGLVDEHYYSLAELFIPFKMFLNIKDYCKFRDEWRAEKKESKKGKKDE